MGALPGNDDDRGHTSLRIAIIYDCLYPHSIGGAERWYRSLAGRLAKSHRVTYLTRTQWQSGEEPNAPELVKLIGLGAPSNLYTASGRRRITSPLRFAAGVFVHLLRNRKQYDVVHTCSFPFFPLLAASAVRELGGPPIVTDWFEVWPPTYWTTYVGQVGGLIGAAVQKLCIRLSGRVFTFSELTANSLRTNGYAGDPVVLRGIYDGPSDFPRPGPVRASLVIYVGRHIAEKNVVAIPAAIALAREALPALKCIIFGDGPERPKVLEAIRNHNLCQHVECPGFVSREKIDEELRKAMCLLFPSEREGYGLVVVEAAAHGTPSIVVNARNNAATALVQHGINGYVADDPSPAALAKAILEIHRSGPALVTKTSTWFKEHQTSLGIESSIPEIERAYLEAAGVASPRVSSL
jgi:glycosyltransferase involved in cell wall biosynthesis